MQAIATQKFVRMSPRKLRLVADMVRDLDPQRAVEILPQIGKRAGEPLGKVMKTAIANAKVKGISSADLIIKEIQINEGPRLKRGRPVSRGRWHPYKRRMSHIRIILSAEDKRKKGFKGATGMKKSMDKKPATTQDAGKSTEAQKGKSVTRKVQRSLLGVLKKKSGLGSKSRIEKGGKAPKKPA